MGLISLRMTPEMESKTISFFISFCSYYNRRYGERAEMEMGE